MAIVIPMRKKYKPRHIVESVVNNVLRLRSNCQTMTNPNTPAQQHMRSRFALMQKLQAGLSPLLQRGFDRQLNARERWVSAYHIALGHNITEAAQYNAHTQRWECRFSRFAICQHRSRAPKRITVQREGKFLILSYHWKGQAERTSILWAIYNRKRGLWVQGIEDTRLHGKIRACAIPPEWAEEPLEVLIGFGRDAQGRGKLRGTHHFTFDKSVGIVTVRGGMPSVQKAITQGSKEYTTLYLGIRTLLPLAGTKSATTPRLHVLDAGGISFTINVLILYE